MWFRRSPILHVVGTHTKFLSTTTIAGRTPTDVWNAFVECWAVLHIGYPNIIRLDQKAEFVATSFRELANSHGMKL